MVKTTGAKFSNLLLLFISFVFICCLTGCGNGEDVATGTGSNTTAATPSITLSVSNVTFGTPVTAQATVTNSSGAPIQGVVVTFSDSSGLVTFTPTSKTALTNASGVASMTINAANVDSTGATYITSSASVTVNGTATSVSDSVGISVGGATVTLGALTVATSPISAHGTSSISVPVLIGGSPATVPISVSFISLCGATLSTPVISSAGVAVSTYKDNGCASGTTAVVDTITASVTSGASASANITIQPTVANNIQFVSAVPEVIGIKGTGNAALPQSSLVTFKVVDNSGTGKPNVLVDFSLLPTTVPGGVTFSPSSATSGSDGTVQTTVSSGTIPTPVWVVAAIDSTPTIKSQSNRLTITTGMPSQKHFSLAVQTHNLECLTYDNVPDTVTVSAYDRLGNPVPDGTAVNFYTEGMGISPANCSTSGGKCSSTFYTQMKSLPSDYRVTILATAVGEETFQDSNGNNTYDAGETFDTLGDLYIDANENGQWDLGEQWFKPNLSEGTSSCAASADAALSKAGTCDATWSINYVRDFNLIICSSSQAQISPTTLSMSSSCRQSFSILLSDINGNPMPAGTTASLSNSNVSYTPFGSTTASSATLSITAGSPVPDATSATSIKLQVAADCTAGTPVAFPTGSADIVITSPRGLSTTIPITVN
jgi:hypothetical protein